MVNQIILIMVLIISKNNKSQKFCIGRSIYGHDCLNNNNSFIGEVLFFIIKKNVVFLLLDTIY